MKLIKILNSVIALLSILMIIIISKYLYQVAIQKKDYGTIFGYTVFKIATGSMEPTINIGSRVIIKLTNDIKDNDIIVYKKDLDYVCHRVEKINKNGVICKGDNNNVEDDEISKSNIIGKVIFII